MVSLGLVYKQQSINENTKIHSIRSLFTFTLQHIISHVCSLLSVRRGRRKEELAEFLCNRESENTPEPCRTHAPGTRRLQFPMRTRQERKDSTTTTLSTSASRRKHEASAHPWQEQRVRMHPSDLHFFPVVFPVVFPVDDDGQPFLRQRRGHDNPHLRLRRSPHGSASGLRPHTPPATPTSAARSLLLPVSHQMRTCSSTDCICMDIHAYFDHPRA